MVNSSSNQAGELRSIITLIRTYVAIVFGTLVALVALSASAPHLVTSDAWVHEVIVTLFALVLSLRLRTGRAGNANALRAVGIIAAVLAVVNLVEALIPDLFPVWMRMEMVIIAALMAIVVTLVVRTRPRAIVFEQGMPSQSRPPPQDHSADGRLSADERRTAPPWAFQAENARRRVTRDGRM
jgi:hypothetical protein